MSNLEPKAAARWQPLHPPASAEEVAQAPTPTSWCCLVSTGPGLRYQTLIGFWHSERGVSSCLPYTAAAKQHMKKYPLLTSSSPLCPFSSPTGSCYRCVFPTQQHVLPFSSSRVTALSLSLWHTAPACSYGLVCRCNDAGWTQGDHETEETFFQKRGPTMKRGKVTQKRYLRPAFCFSYLCRRLSWMRNREEWLHGAGGPFRNLPKRTKRCWHEDLLQ